MCLAAATGSWLALSTENTLRSATLLLAGPAAVALAAGLVLRIPAGIPLAIGLLGLAYTLRLLFEEDALDQRAPLIAAALFAIAELSYWSLEVRESVADEPGAYLRRAGLLATMTLGALALGVALLGLVDAVQTGGAALEGAGVVAAVAALALLALAARRTEP